LPSATEIVYALGLGDQLVGVTFECDEPPSARLEKAVVVAGRDTAAMTAGEIDAYVRAKSTAGEQLYTLDQDALAGLDPDIVITQDLCWVCAIPSGQVDDALAFLGCRADVVSLDPNSLEDVLESIHIVGARTGMQRRATELVPGLRARLAKVAAAVAGRPHPRVAAIEWVDPPFPGGHWVPDLIAAAGGEPVAAMANTPSAPTTWSEIARARPDVVIVAPCGYHLSGAAEQAAVVADALPGPAIWAIDADGIVVRPGPRLIDGVEAVAAILHPAVVPPSSAVLRIR
jgi:iron complex transport system substrate-binding protein